MSGTSDVPVYDTVDQSIQLLRELVRSVPVSKLDLKVMPALFAAEDAIRTLGGYLETPVA